MFRLECTFPPQAALWSFVGFHSYQPLSLWPFAPQRSLSLHNMRDRQVVPSIHRSYNFPIIIIKFIDLPPPLFFIYLFSPFVIYFQSASILTQPTALKTRHQRINCKGVYYYTVTTTTTDWGETDHHHIPRPNIDLTEAREPSGEVETSPATIDDPHPSVCDCVVS